jgi:hypothetical protein
MDKGIGHWLGRKKRVYKGKKATTYIPLRRPKRMCMDSIEEGLGEIARSGVDWIGLAHDSDKWSALVNVVMNRRFP